MLTDLFAGDFERYFSAPAPQMWLQLHVPKTAGSSLIAEASAILRPAYHIGIDHADSRLSYRDRYDAAVAGFVAAQAGGGGFRFCTGHIDWRQALMIRRVVGDMRCFTFLREPVARLVSDYRYQRSAMNTVRAAFVAGTPDFAAYVARPHVHNKMARSLSPRRLALAGDVAGCVDHIMREFAFVGLQEMYPLGVRALTRAMGEERAGSARVRVNDGGEDAVELSNADRAALLELNAVDVGVYAAFAERWAAVREGLAGYLGAG